MSEEIWKRGQLPAPPLGFWYQLPVPKGMGLVCPETTGPMSEAAIWMMSSQPSALMS